MHEDPVVWSWQREATLAVAPLDASCGPDRSGVVKVADGSHAGPGPTCCRQATWPPTSCIWPCGGASVFSHCMPAHGAFGAAWVCGRADVDRSCARGSWAKGPATPRLRAWATSLVLQGLIRLRARHSASQLGTTLVELLSSCCVARHVAGWAASSTQQQQPTAAPSTSNQLQQPAAASSSQQQQLAAAANRSSQQQHAAAAAAINSSESTAPSQQQHPAAASSSQQQQPTAASSSSQQQQPWAFGPAALARRGGGRLAGGCPLARNRYGAQSAAAPLGACRCLLDTHWTALNGCNKNMFVRINVPRLGAKMPAGHAHGVYRAAVSHPEFCGQQSRAF